MEIKKIETRYYMFNHSVLIYKDTKEIRENLKKLGYKVNIPKSFAMGLITNTDGTVWDAGQVSYLDDCVKCGTNDTLFLAIAALRDDTDYGQWFIDRTNTLFRYFDNDKNFKIFDITGDLSEYHKMSVEELFNVFGNEEN